MFNSGAGVEVIENHGYMTARVFLPSSFSVRSQLNKKLLLLVDF